MAYQYTSPVSSTRLAQPTSSRFVGNTRTFGTTSLGLSSLGSSSIAPVTTPSSLSQTITSGGRVATSLPTRTLAGANTRVSTANYVNASRPGASPYATSRVVSSVGATSYAAGGLLSATRPFEYAAPLSSAKVVESSPIIRTSAPVVFSEASLTPGGVRQAKVLSGGIGGVSGYIGSPTIQYAGATLAPTVVSSNPMINAGATQQAYEAKHQGDAQLANLKELKAKCGLRKVPVLAAAEAFKYAAAGTGALTRDQFFEAHSVLLDSCGVDHPPADVKNAVFDLFDRDDNGSVDMMEIVCGISLLCRGTEEEKVEAVFMMFDENGDGYVTVDEMYKFLSTVFKVVCTPAVMQVVNENGVDTSAEDMASATTMECFQTADLNHDGKLSLDEFKKWFNAPRNDPAVLFEPVSAMLA